MPESVQIFAVVLAAGRAERFGRTKQLERIDDEPLVRRALRTAHEACGDNVVLVIGHDSAKVLEAAADECRFVAVSEEYLDGIGSSIACAVRAIGHAADAALVMLADQALVSSDHLSSLIAAWSGKSHDIVATAFAGVQGPPILFGKGAFGDLQELSGDNGAKSLLTNKQFEVTTVWSDDASVDIDTSDDLDRVRRSVRN